MTTAQMAEELDDLYDSLVEIYNLVVTDDFDSDEIIEIVSRHLDLDDEAEG